MRSTISTAASSSIVSAGSSVTGFSRKFRSWPKRGCGSCYVMATHAATVTEIEELAPAVVQLTVSIHDSNFRFEPGQWVNFRFPEGVSRAYTIASAPQRPTAVQLCVRLGEGRGGKALKQLQPGASVSVEGPYGDFLLPEDGHNSVV